LPDALSQLRQRIVDTRAALVVIDPLTSLLARGVSPLDGQDVRSVVCPLQALARELGIVVLITLNNRKSTGGPASDWVSGSKEWWNVPRHILCMARDPKRPNHGIIAVGKQSRGGRRPSLSVRFDQENGVDQMVIVGDSDATARDLGREPEDDLGRSARELAQAYLRRCLDDGDERASRLLSESEAAGFSRHTLDRAAHDMGVRREFRSANGERAWWWCRPENWPK